MAFTVNDNSFLTIQGWMLSEELGLKSANELMIYALIHGFSQDGESYFYGSLSYIMKWTKMSKMSVLRILQSLTERKLLIKKDVKSLPFSEKKAWGAQHFCLYCTSKSREKNADDALSVTKMLLDSGNKMVLDTGNKLLHNNIAYNNINLDNINSPQYSNSHINNNLNSVDDKSSTNLNVIQKDLTEINNNLNNINNSKTNISEKEKLNNNNLNLQDNLNSEIQDNNLNTDILNLNNQDSDKQTRCLEILKNKKIDTSKTSSESTSSKIVVSNTLKTSKTRFEKIDYDECRRILYENRDFLISQNKKIDTSEFDYKILQRWLKNCFTSYGVEKTKLGLRNSVKDEWLVNQTGYAFTALFSNKIFPRLISNAQSDFKTKNENEKHHSIDFSNQNYSTSW